MLTADAYDTLKYLIREHACLLFMEFLSFSACTFSCNNTDRIVLRIPNGRSN